ncbi:MAG: hypothetical protein ISP84_00570 [Candidatus Poseidonia sp.]|nr:hypothetical protein [Poseidonia sp.]
MFTGTVESQSHEGGLLVHFEGTSPALNAIMVRSDDGTYIGKVDGVIGNTNHPLAHIAHVDRNLDMDALIGVQVTVRAKKPRSDDRSNQRREDRGRFDDRRNNRDRNGGGDRRFGSGRDDRRNNRDRNAGGDRRFGNGRDDRRSGFQRNDRSSGNDQFNNDWTCPACNNSNFARRTACNRCEAPRPAGTGQPSGQRRERAEGRFNQRGDDRPRFDRSNQGRRNDRQGSQNGTFNSNDWTCPACKNSNFSFRDACNRCEAPRPGGRGGGQRQDRGRDGGQRQDRGRDGGQRQDRERDGGQRQDRGRDGGQHQDRGRRDDRRSPPSNDRRPTNNQDGFRRAKGKRSGHAHNQPPRDFREPRKFERRSDD